MVIIDRCNDDNPGFSTLTLPPWLTPFPSGSLWLDKVAQSQSSWETDSHTARESVQLPLEG